jgi:hypothetical protein
MRLGLVFFMLLSLAMQCEDSASVTVENVSSGEVTVVVDNEHSARIPPGATAYLDLPAHYAPERIEVRRDATLVFSITLEKPTTRFRTMHLVINDDGVSIAGSDEADGGQN